MPGNSLMDGERRIIAEIGLRSVSITHRVLVQVRGASEVVWVHAGDSVVISCQRSKVGRQGRPAVMPEPGRYGQQVVVLKELADSLFILRRLLFLFRHALRQRQFGLPGIIVPL